MAKKNAYDKVTEAMIAQLDKGVIPWRRPWATKGNMPANFATGREYTGFMNCMLLACSGYESRYWATFGQIKKMGGKLKSDSRGTGRIITFGSKITTKDRITGEDKDIWLRKAWTVFNLGQTEGLENKKRAIAERAQNEQPAPDSTEGYEEFMSIAESFLKTSGPDFQTQGSLAAYSPKRDRIVMPKLETFKSTDHYAATLAHEVTHSTGHQKRLAREGVVNEIRYGSHTYSKEELVAEMGSAFFAGICGFGTEEVFENSAAYVESWRKELSKDPKLIVHAASEAQKAVDLVLRASGRSRLAEDTKEEKAA